MRNKTIETTSKRELSHVIGGLNSSQQYTISVTAMVEDKKEDGDTTTNTANSVTNWTCKLEIKNTRIPILVTISQISLKAIIRN